MFGEDLSHSYRTPVTGAIVRQEFRLIRLVEVGLSGLNRRAGGSGNFGIMEVSKLETLL